MSSIFLDGNCMVTTYTLAAISKLGLECLDWDPLIVRDAFQQAFGIKLTQKGFDKLMAGLSMVGTDLYTSSIQGFLACTAQMNNDVFNQNEAPFVDLKQCCWGVWAYRQLIGDSEEQFNPDIVVYIQNLMKVDGISKLPDYMSFAAFTKDQMQPIDQALIGDQAAFTAYYNRQDVQVDEIITYVKQQQNMLITQLTQLKKQGIITPDVAA